MVKNSQADLWEQLDSGLLKPSSDDSRNAMVRLPMLTKPERQHALRMPRDPAKINPSIVADLRAACRGELRWPVTIRGDTGTGKTCASLVIADYTAHASWFEFGDFCQRFADARMGKLSMPYGSESREIGATQWWDWLEKRRLLVLDDIREFATVSDTRYDAVKMALDRRYGMPLILTTNLTLKEIAKAFDMRIADRLAGGTVIVATGESMR